MTISGTLPRALYSEPHLQQGQTTSQSTSFGRGDLPKFGRGFTDFVAKGVEWISASSSRELLLTDFAGMTGPRTGAELVFRGPDMGA